MRSEIPLIRRFECIWRDAFAIDLRSLALFRVAVAATLLYNLATRSQDLTAMYTDSGYLPVDEWKQLVPDASFWSLHACGGETLWVAAVFIVHAVAGLALLVGYRARVASMVAWLLTVSLHHRNPLLISGGDVLLGMLLFWGMFLPTDARWSLAAWQGKHKSLPQRYFSAATCGAMLQVFLMYFVTGLSKCNEAWWSGEALFRVFQYDLIVRPLGQFMLSMPVLLKGLTLLALMLELVGPWLLLVSKFSYRVRMFAVVALVGLHLGIELTMQVLIFSWVSLAGLTLFLPPMFWDWFQAGRQVGEVPSGESVPPPLRWGEQWGRRFVAIFSAAAILYAITYNLLFIGKFTAMPVEISTPLNQGIERVGEVFGWTQRWNMFSKPKPHEFRFATVATLPSGELIDILHAGSPVALERPASIEPRAASQRWMLTLLHLARPEHAKFLPTVANYLLRQWNQTHEQSRQVDLVDHLAVVTSLDAQGAPENVEILRLIQVDRYAQGRYVEGQPDGPWEFRHRNGKRSAVGEFRQGVKVGEWTTWYPDGSIESRGVYKNDLLDGPWEFYDEQGQCIREVYHEGRIESEGSVDGTPTPSAAWKAVPRLLD